MAKAPTIQNLGQLRATDYSSRSVREELRCNMIAAIRAGERLFPGIIGYEASVEPQLVTALLARHDILLLGLRGQAKTRILRGLTAFLDEWVPVLEGSPLREDPLNPVLESSRLRIDQLGDDCPVSWMHRSERFVEKLATPDANISDLIGDIDPIKASREKLDLSDPDVIHYGIVPRSHRGLFCINELPDLQPRIQVGLLNILEEKDVQIRGFPIRLELDITMLFTANPEDYTNRGRIITPLKDRIPSQIITHYPDSIDSTIEIMEQEANIDGFDTLGLPNLCKEIVAEVAVQARQSDLVDQSSGVSARLTISAYESLCAQVERRRFSYGETDDGVRLSDLYALVPAVCGKLELVFEGQETGAEVVAQRLISQAIKAVFTRSFKCEQKDKHDDPFESWETVLHWFNDGGRIEMVESQKRSELSEQLLAIPHLAEKVEQALGQMEGAELDFTMEMALDGLHHFRHLSKEGLGAQVVYGDALSGLMDDFGTGT